MAVVTPTPTHPSISGTITPIPGPIDPDVMRGQFNTNVGLAEDKAQLSVAFLEKLQAGLGNGALSGGTISAGGGLDVSVAALTALVGTYVEFDASQTVGGLTANTTNYLFLRQDSTWTVNTSGTAPADIAAHGAYLLWGTATTDASSVTGVSNVRTEFYQAILSTLFNTSGTATATAGAATLNSRRGTITSEALTTAAGSDYVLTLTNNKITAASQVFASVDNGTNTTEGLSVQRVTPGSNQVVIRVRNTHASSALNGSIKISFVVF